MRVSRRRLIAGAAATIASRRARAAVPWARGGRATVPAAAVPGRSFTVYNTAGTTSPANTPFRRVMSFKEGEVPTGSIAVPQEGGVDVPYQADCRRYHADGSLALATFYFVRAAGIAGNGSIQVTFAVRVGAYTNVSSITTADIVAERDYQIALSNVHTALAGTIGGGIGAVSTMSVTLDGSGGVSGGKAIYPTNLTLGTTNVVSGGGTGGQVSVSNGVVTVVNPGSGYGFVGSGSFTHSANAIIAAINANGNRTNGMELVWYARGLLVDAVRVRAILPSLPHWHTTFYVERWKKPDGTLLQYRAYTACGTGWVDTTTTISNLTYDFDLKNGSTVIAGASLGDERFQSVLHYLGASFHSFDDQARPSWESNDAAFKAIVPLLDPTEAGYFRSTKIALPWLDLVPNTPVPTTTAYFELTSNGGREVVCRYRPGGNAGIRAALGSPGNGSQENPMNEVDALLWEAQRNGDLAGALVWLNNARVAAAHAGSFPQLGGACAVEKTTTYPANVVPAATQAFAGMTPTREATTGSSQVSSGFTQPMIAGTSITSIIGAATNTYHHVSVIYGPAITEGEQWMLDSQENACATQVWYRNPTYTREATVGTTTYYGVNAGQLGNRRVPAWTQRALIQAVRSLPTTWSDGSTNVVRDYLSYLCQSHILYLLTLVSHIGTVKIGRGGFPTITKTVDYTGTGAYPEAAMTDLQGAGTGGADFINQFMDAYEMMVYAQGYALLKGTTLGNIIITWLNYRKTFWGGLFQGNNTALYGKIGFYISNYTHVMPNAPIADPTWGPLNPANPGVELAPFGYNAGARPQVGMGFTSGSKIVTLNFGVAWYYPTLTTYISDGSRIRLTNLTNGGGGGVPPPAFDLSTHYYWLQTPGDPTSGQLCTGLDGGGNPDPATAVTADATVPLGINAVSFWFIPGPGNVLPSNTTPGAGWYNNPGGDGTAYSRVATFLGATRALIAAGVFSDTVDLSSAALNLQTLMTTAGGSYTSTVSGGGIQYAFADTYG